MKVIFVLNEPYMAYRTLNNVYLENNRPDNYIYKSLVFKYKHKKPDKWDGQERRWWKNWNCGDINLWTDVKSRGII